MINASGVGAVTPLTSDGASDFLPVWSRDGSRILFQSDRPTPSVGAYEIWRMDANGANQTKIIAKPGNDTSPNW